MFTRRISPDGPSRAFDRNWHSKRLLFLSTWTVIVKSAKNTFKISVSHFVVFLVYLMVVLFFLFSLATPSRRIISRCFCEHSNMNLYLLNVIRRSAKMVKIWKPTGKSHTRSKYVALKWWNNTIKGALCNFCKQSFWFIAQNSWTVGLLDGQRAPWLHVNSCKLLFLVSPVLSVLRPVKKLHDAL